MPGKRAKKISEFRHFLKLDQTEFGELFGVKQSTVSAWENEEKDTVIELKTARKIIRKAKEVGFDLTLNDVYGEISEG